MNKNLEEKIQKNASLLYHPLARIYKPCIELGLWNAIAVLDRLGDGQIHTSAEIANHTGIAPRETKAILRALANSNELPFIHSGTGKGGRSKIPQSWQLPPHPTTKHPFLSKFKSDAVVSKDQADTDEVLEAFALRLYHPASRFFMPCFREGINNAIALIDLLSGVVCLDLEGFSTKQLSEEMNLSYSRTQRLLQILKAAGLPFTQYGVQGNSPSSTWQLKPHPLANNQDYLKLFLGFAHPKPKTQVPIGT